MAQRANHGRAVPAGDIAGRAVAQLVPRDRLRLTRVQVAWTTIAPGRLREVAWPGSINADTLTVHVLDNQWLHELMYMRAELLERVQKSCPAAGIEALRLRVGPLADAAPEARRRPDPPPPTLPTEPAPDTIAALKSIDNSTLRQAMANARMALAGRLRKP